MRENAQKLIQMAGADGPMSLEAVVERVHARLTASEQELVKIRVEKDEQWAKLCVAVREIERLREILQDTLEEWYESHKAQTA